MSPEKELVVARGLEVTSIDARGAGAAARFVYFSRKLRLTVMRRVHLELGRLRSVQIASFVACAARARFSSDQLLFQA